MPSCGSSNSWISNPCRAKRVTVEAARAGKPETSLGFYTCVLQVYEEKYHMYASLG